MTLVRMGGGFSMIAPYTAGSRTGDTYTIGQPVKVRIKKIDMTLRQMDLELAEDLPMVPSSRTEGRRRKSKMKE